MIKNYLLITLRNLFRNKVFIAINIAGMGLAIGCCIVAFLNWDFSHRFDTNHINAESIYRVQAWQYYQDEQNRYATVPAALGNVVKQNTEVDAVVRYTTAPSDFRIGDEVFNTAVSYADSAFFDLFSFDLVDGNFSSFHDKSQIIISEDLARKYFDAEHVTGMQITQIINGRLKEYTIGGVFKLQPLNSSFPFEAITLWDNYKDIAENGATLDNDWKSMSTLFLQIKNPSRVESVISQLQKYIEPQNKAREDLQLSSYYLQNFATLAASFYGDTWLSDEQLRWGMPPTAIIGPSVMAVFLLLLAAFNFTNTFVSISGRRLKEIGLRKAMGGLRSQLVVQFLGESIVLCFLALICGLLFAEILVPAYNSLWPGVKLTLSYTENALFFIYLISLLIFTALVAGIYPALYITAFKPVSILKGKMKFGGTNWFTRTLLTLQFAISLLCIISAVAFIKNASYQENYGFGYYKSGVVVAPVNGEGEYNAFRNALSLNSDIHVVAGSKHHVSDMYYRQPVKYENREHQVEIVDVGENYVEAMGIEILEGRDFQLDSETDRKESVLVSEEFVRTFGWEDNPIGKRLVVNDSLQVFVVGVVNDILTDGFWKPAAPAMLRYVGADQYTQILVSTAPENVLAVNEFMKEKWKAISPNSLYEGNYIDGNMYASQMINSNTVKLFGFLGIIAVIMSATGLFALVSLNIVKKMKELGVRKVLGASMGHLMRVINFEFVIILMVASILGGGLGFVAIDGMMDAIWEYYQQVDISTLAIATAGLFLIAFLTIGYKTIRTALTNPVHVLREE